MVIGKSDMTCVSGLSASQEDYLETIYHIVNEQRVARAKDIAQSMNVRSSSVTGALHALSERGLVNYEPYGLITLTDEGEGIARSVVRRHDGLRNFLVKVLGVEESEAEAGACQMEHAISQKILTRLVAYTEEVTGEQEVDL